MRKETIQKLSALIRDRDMQIEALTQKNTSLLAVLQEQGSSNQSAGSCPPKIEPLIDWRV